MTSKNSTLRNSILIATFALLPLGAVQASAQTKSVTVEVPFAFVANHTSLPAGRYLVLGKDDLITFVNADTSKYQAMLLTRHEPSDSPAWPGKLEFYVSGSRHVLTEVQFGGTSTHNVLLRQPKPERTVASNTQPAPQKIEIAMR